MTIRRLPAIHSFAHGTLKSMKNSVKKKLQIKKHNLSNHPFSRPGQYMHVYLGIHIYTFYMFIHNTIKSLHDGVKIHIHIIQSLLKIIYKIYIFL